MTLHVLEIPDDTAQLPLWLERQLLGDDLSALVAQLEAVHGAPAGTAPTLTEALGGRRAAVMREGLNALTTEQLSRLLVQPRVLLDLQEALLLEAGPYWTQQGGNSPKLENDLRRGRRRMSRYLATQAEAPRATPATIPMRRQMPWSRREVLVALASAAAVLIAVFGYQASISGPSAPPETAVAWGWAKPGALPQTGSRKEYLGALAAAANEWFTKQPDNAGDLAKRISQLRQGCSTLILAAHKPLPAADRDWLIERCKAWAKKFDDQLARVEAGDDPSKVREATNETVTNLIKALNARADAPATA